MPRMVMGSEAEFALKVEGPEGRVPHDRAADLFWHSAMRRLRHLPSQREHGVFLENGARLLVDYGCHPEYAAPECANPWDFVRYALAGDAVMEAAAGQIRDEFDRDLSASVYKSNVSYAPGCSWETWGCHESYLYHSAPETIAREMIPHFVSRIVFTGAGGFDSTSDGVHFLVSPRVAHLTAVMSDNSTAQRGIFHTKNEALGRHGNRMHVICGENTCSHRALWLKASTTSLVLVLADAGLMPGASVQLAAPLDAMRKFSRDVHCRQTVESVSGKRLSAIDIQRHYLEQVEAHLGEGLLPEWAPEVCRHWRAMLDRLSAGAPESVATTLDWAIKWALYSEQVRKAGMDWQDISLLSAVIERLAQSFRERQIPEEKELNLPDSVWDVFEQEKNSGVIGYLLQRHHLTKDDLQRCRGLRQRLFEIDTRFSQLGERGIFNQLDKTGALDHRVPGVERIQEAVGNPPRDTRARIRAEWVQRLASRGDATADWDSVCDFKQKFFLRLDDPLMIQEPPRENLPGVASQEPLVPLSAGTTVSRVMRYARRVRETNPNLDLETLLAREDARGEPRRRGESFEAWCMRVLESALSETERNGAGGR